MCRHINILAVDNDSDNLVILGMALALDPAVNVCTSPSAFRALQIVRDGTFQPDLALLDGHFSDVGTRTLASHLNEIGVPVVIMTCGMSKADAAEFVADGAMAVMLKPYDPLTLARELRRHLTVGHGLKKMDLREEVHQTV